MSLDNNKVHMEKGVLSFIKTGLDKVITQTLTRDFCKNKEQSVIPKRCEGRGFGRKSCLGRPQYNKLREGNTS